MRAAILVGLLVLASSPSTWANGGDQRVAEGRYLVNLSRAPFTPRVGNTTAMLVSFLDIQKNKLITDDLNVRIRIAQLDTKDKERVWLYEDTYQVRGGVLEFSYVFESPGLHEIFADFSFASTPGQLIEPPDFLIDVQSGKDSAASAKEFAFGILGLASGIAVGWSIHKMKRS